MRSQESDPQKILRTALARAGLVDYWVHTCRRCKRRGEPYSERHADGELRGCPRCGMKLWPTAKVRPMRFHDLRHSVATLLLRERVDAHRVQRLLRHRDVKTTTGTYGHLVVEDLREAINLLPPAPFAASLLQDPRSTPSGRAELDDADRGESGSWIGAGNGSRTRDPQLGKLMLYQLSYSRSGL
jgi:integrase-like protein